MVTTDSPTRRGSSRSSGCGLPVSIWQKSQRRVHWSPPMRKVASRSSQHSKMLGQPASWQTVWSPSDFTRDCSAVYSGPIRARVLIHSGLRSMGVSALRTSSRSSLRPSGAELTPRAYAGEPAHYDSALASLVSRWLPIRVDIFDAIADPVRRSLLADLAHGP